MLAQEVFDMTSHRALLNSNRQKIRDKLHKEMGVPEDSITCLNDYPYVFSVELGRTASSEDIKCLQGWGCDCRSYGNAAKSRTGEGVSAIVVRF